MPIRSRYLTRRGRRLLNGGNLGDDAQYLVLQFKFLNPHLTPEFISTLQPESQELLNMFWPDRYRDIGYLMRTVLRNPRYEQDGAARLRRDIEMMRGIATHHENMRDQFPSGGSVSMEEDAKLARAAYGGKRVEGYTIDPELSNQNYTTYVDRHGKATMAFRGTNPKNWRDLGTDALLSLGLQGISTRFQNSKKAVDRARTKYGDIDLTGHSLGGSQAMYLSNQRGLNARTFNPGVGPAEVFRNRNYSRVQNYHVKGDPISMLSRYVKGLKTTTRGALARDAHSMSNFSQFT